MVNKEALAHHARRLGLERALRLGRGEGRTGGSEKASNLSNVFEAVLGAMYLDGGLEPVRTLVVREFGEELTDPDRTLADAKTRLQERLHALSGEVPRYTTTATRGPDHEPEFLVEVCLESRVLARGEGRSKREAEQTAARRALEVLESEPA
jgi:ribonuclease-3